MAQKKLPYAAGDWVALRIDHGFAAALLARVNHHGICLGYFYGQLHDAPPTLESLQHLRPEDAILVHRFGGPYLESGRWLVIGHDPTWDPAAWPLPAFRHKDGVSGEWRIREYSDDESLWITSDRAATAEEVAQLPEDGCADARYMEECVAEVIGVARTAVSNWRPPAASVSHGPAQHYLYFHDRELAERAANACHALGLESVLAPSADEEKPWLLLVQHRNRTQSDAEMEQAAGEVAALAAEWGGEYDGWDRPV